MSAFTAHSAPFQSTLFYSKKAYDQEYMAGNKTPHVIQLNLMQCKPYKVFLYFQIHETENIAYIPFTYVLSHLIYTRTPLQVGKNENNQNCIQYLKKMKINLIN